MTKRSPTEYAAGDFRNPVTVQSPVYIPDDKGGQKTTWAGDLRLYVSAVQKSANETYGDSSNGRLRTNETWTFTTWFRTDITTSMRILWKGRYFNIRSVNDFGSRGKYLVIEAEVGVEQ